MYVFLVVVRFRSLLRYSFLVIVAAVRANMVQTYTLGCVASFVVFFSSSSFRMLA